MSCRNSHFTGPGDFPFLQLVTCLVTPMAPSHSHLRVSAHALPLCYRCTELPIVSEVLTLWWLSHHLWLFLALSPLCREYLPLSLPLATKYQFTLYISIHKSPPSLFTFPNLLLFLLAQHCA